MMLAQDVSLEISLFSYLNKRKLQQDFFTFECGSLFTYCINTGNICHIFFPLNEAFRKADMFFLSGGTEE